MKALKDQKENGELCGSKEMVHQDGQNKKMSRNQTKFGRLFGKTKKERIL